MFKELFRPGVPLPSDKEGATKYAEEMADGIKVWVKIDFFVLVPVAILYAIGVIEIMWLSIAIFFAIGCPTIMVLGFSISILRYLTSREMWEIVRKRI